MLHSFILSRVCLPKLPSLLSRLPGAKNKQKKKKHKKKQQQQKQKQKKKQNKKKKQKKKRKQKQKWNPPNLNNLSSI